MKTNIFFEDDSENEKNTSLIIVKDIENSDYGIYFEENLK